MKPPDWDSLDDKVKDEMASDMLRSLRGRLLMSQALHYAIKTMSTEKFPETSNIQDMEMIRERIYSWPVFEPGVAEPAMGRGKQ